MDVVTLGETMVIFTPTNTGPIRNADLFSMKYGGAESNVAIGLSRLGHRVGWISKLGRDEFGKAIFHFLKGEGVEVSQVKFDHEAPTGIYFKELRKKNDVRVHYYRNGSAASKLSKNDIEKSYIAKAKFLHITGITPALSPSCLDAIYYAIDCAMENNVKVIFDPNLRSKLWTEKKARKTLLDIASRSDIVLPGLLEGIFLFGIQDVDQLGNLFLENGAELVILKDGENGAYYYSATENGKVNGFPVDEVVDPIGAGDAFAAGFLSGLLEGVNIRNAVSRGNALGALATMYNGDIEGLPEKEELEKFLEINRVDVNR